jgi:hypothetical protein
VIGASRKLKIRARPSGARIPMIRIDRSRTRRLRSLPAIVKRARDEHGWR